MVARPSGWWSIRWSASEESECMCVCKSVRVSEKIRSTHKRTTGEKRERERVFVAVVFVAVA